MVKHDGYRRWVLGAALAATMAYALSAAGWGSSCGCGAACGCRLPQRSMATEAAGTGACCSAATRGAGPCQTEEPEASLAVPACGCQPDGPSNSTPPCQCLASENETPVVLPQARPTGGEPIMVASLLSNVYVVLPPSAASSDPVHIARRLPRVNLQQWLCVWRD